MTCNIAKAGPRTGALKPDTGAGRAGNKAYNPSLEACLGNSGSCMSMNGDSCCVGTGSYIFGTPSGAGPCDENCETYWSGISSKRPLSDLWSEVQAELPVEPPLRRRASRRSSRQGRRLQRAQRE
jgi:hypothetical protein